MLKFILVVAGAFIAFVCWCFCIAASEADRQMGYDELPEENFED